jgi:hypothetical protein
VVSRASGSPVDLVEDGSLVYWTQAARRRGRTTLVNFGAPVAGSGTLGRTFSFASDLRRLFALVPNGARELLAVGQIAPRGPTGVASGRSARRLGAPEPLAPDPTIGVAVAADDESGVAVVYQVTGRARNRRASRRALFLRVAGPGDELGRAVRVAGPGAQSELATAINDRGDVLVAWRRRSGAVFARRVSATGRLGGVQQLDRVSPGLSSTGLEASLTTDGQAAVAWTDGDDLEESPPSGPADLLVSVAANRTSSFGPPATLERVDASIGRSGWRPGIELAPSGPNRTLVAWNGQDPGDRGAVRVSDIQGATPAAPQSFATTTANVSLDDLGVSPRGDAYVGWTEQQLSPDNSVLASRVLAAVRAGGAPAFGAVEEVSNSGALLDFAFPRSGGALAAFQAVSGETSRPALSRRGA